MNKKPIIVSIFKTVKGKSKVINLTECDLFSVRIDNKEHIFTAGFFEQYLKNLNKTNESKEETV